MITQSQRYSPALYRDRVAVIDQINFDRKIHGIEYVQLRMMRSDWLFLMGLYDTMFIVGLKV